MSCILHALCPNAICTSCHPSPLQDARVREVLGFGKGDGSSVDGKLLTVVHGTDLVNVTFLNFQAMQEDIAKVLKVYCNCRCRFGI